MVRTVTVQEFAEKNSDEKEAQIVDVRSPSEFASGHVPRAVNVPLEQLGQRVQDLKRDAPTFLLCQSGHRAQIAARQLDSSFPKLAVVAGGTAAWVAAGHPVIQTTGIGWSLERQVRFGAGLLILVTLALATLVSYKWLWGTAFVGAGLTFAGATDICGMGMILAAMPWNRRSAPVHSAH